MTTPKQPDASGASPRARLVDDPLIRFVVIGALLFAVDRALAARDAPSDADADADARIVIASSFVDGLRARHRERTGEEADAEEEAALIADYVREETLYREALAAGLDAGDLIVRRRLVQKMEFALAAAVELEEPSDATLEAYVREHASALLRPRRTALRHAFFSRDVHGDGTVAVASAALATLALADAEAGAHLGEPFLRGAHIGPATDTQIDGAFGVGFAAAIEPLAVGAWAGPVESGFGAHLVFVEAREAARAPSLDEVRDRARSAWEEEARAAAVEDAIEELVARHPVVREDDAR